MSHPCNTFSNLLYFHVYDLLLNVLPLFTNLILKNKNTFWLFICYHLLFQLIHVEGYSILGLTVQFLQPLDLFVNGCIMITHEIFFLVRDFKAILIQIIFGNQLIYIYLLEIVFICIPLSYKIWFFRTVDDVLFGHGARNETKVTFLWNHKYFG
jgi:hypothetical protein